MESKMIRLPDVEKLIDEWVKKQGEKLNTTPTIHAVVLTSNCEQCYRDGDIQEGEPKATIIPSTRIENTSDQEGKKIERAQSHEHSFTQSDTTITEYKGHAGISIGIDIAKLGISGEITEHLEKVKSSIDAHKMELRVTESLPIGHFYAMFKIEKPLIQIYAVRNAKLRGHITVAFDKDVPGYDKKTHTFSNVRRSSRWQDIQVKDIFDALKANNHSGANEWKIGKNSITFTSVIKGQTEWMVSYSIPQTNKIPGFEKLPAGKSVDHHQSKDKTTSLPTNIGVQGSVGLAVNSQAIGYIEYDMPLDILDNDTKVNNWIKIEKTRKKDKANNIGISGNVTTMVNTLAAGKGGAQDLLKMAQGLLKIKVPENIDPNQNPKEFEDHIKQEVASIRAAQRVVSSESSATTIVEHYSSPLSQAQSPKELKPETVSADVIQDVQKKSLNSSI